MMKLDNGRMLFLIVNLVNKLSIMTGILISKAFTFRVSGNETSVFWLNIKGISASCFSYNGRVWASLCGVQLVHNLLQISGN